MKSFTYRILAAAIIILAFLGLFVPTAQAQTPTYGPNTLLSSSTVTNGTTRTYDLKIDVSHQATVGVMVSFALVAGAETGNVVTVFQRSVDGSVWETTGTTVTTASNGTNSVNTLTKIDSNGAQFIRLHTIANTSNSNNCAVASVTFGTKMSAP